MKLSHIVSVISGPNFSGATRPAMVIPRYAAMRGIEITARQCNYAPTDDAQDVEIPADDAKAILAMDYAERQTENLRAMGEGIGKRSINVPSNINVWQHLKGEGTLANAVRGLADAAKLIAESAAK